MLQAAIDQPVSQIRRHSMVLSPCPALPLVTLLEQLAAVLTRVSDEQYCRQPVGVVTSSLGGHVRHCLDHVESFLAGVDSARIDYDQRARGTDVERDRRAAIESIERIQAAIVELGQLDLRKMVRLEVLLTANGQPIVVDTTVGRELAFVVSHTIHHQALIATMLKLMGINPPEQFGYAPATVAYMRQNSCAR